MCIIMTSSLRLAAENRSKFFLFALITSMSLPVFAADWKLSRQLSLKGTYSDNIELDDAEKTSDFFVELTPGFVLQGKGRRLNLIWPIPYKPCII